MELFAGLMPTTEVSVEAHYTYSKYGIEKCHAYIQAGPNGWSVVLTTYKTYYHEDCISNIQDNYDKAFKKLISVINQNDIRLVSTRSRIL